MAALAVRRRNKTAGIREKDKGTAKQCDNVRQPTLGLTSEHERGSLKGEKKEAGKKKYSKMAI